MEYDAVTEINKLKRNPRLKDRSPDWTDKINRYRPENEPLTTEEKKKLEEYTNQKK